MNNITRLFSATLILLFSFTGIWAQSSQEKPVFSTLQQYEGNLPQAGGDDPAALLRQGLADLQGTPMPLAPGNDNCVNATVLTVGAPCVNGTTGPAGGGGNATIEPGDPNAGCYTGGGGCNIEQTVWYRFTATNDSIWMDLWQTNTANCRGGVGVYGPFTPGGGCMPTIADAIMCDNIHNNADGATDHFLTGLQVGSDYLIQIIGRNGGGANDRYIDFCIALENPERSCATCNNPCGQACGFANPPTVQQVTGGCPDFRFSPHLATGDVTSRCFTFVAASTNVDFNVVISSFCTGGNVTNFTWALFEPNCAAVRRSGTLAQLSTFTGMTIGNSYTFCFTYTAPCTQMTQWPYFVGAEPIVLDANDISDFSGRAQPGYNSLEWTVGSPNQAYTIMRSSDGIAFEELERIEFSGDKVDPLQNRYFDHSPEPVSFYQIRYTGLDGKDQFSGVIRLEAKAGEIGTGIKIMEIYPQPAREGFSIEIEPGLNREVLLSLYDISGKEIMNRNYSTPEVTSLLEVEPEELEPGIYLLKLSGGQTGQTAWQKVIVE